MRVDYTPDQARVAKFIVDLSKDVAGGGDDPIGFILASYRFQSMEIATLRNKVRDALNLIRVGMECGCEPQTQLEPGFICMRCRVLGLAEDDDEFCAECGSSLELVRPGKYQCNKCDLDRMIEKIKADERERCAKLCSERLPFQSGEYYANCIRQELE